MDGQWLTADLFAGREGERFELRRTETDVLSVTLAQVRRSAEPGGTGPEGQERTQFSLEFRGPLEPALPQATYTLEHAEIGPLMLFLVPVAQDSDSTTYEAAFA